MFLKRCQLRSLELYDQFVEDLKSLVGANVSFRPMYPSFPQQVMMASEAELYVNAIYHYITLRLPEYVALERFPLLDQVDLKIIDLGSVDDFDQIIRNLIRAKVRCPTPTKKISNGCFDL